MMASHAGSDLAARVPQVGLLTLALALPLGGSGCAAEVGRDAEDPRGDIILAISGGKALSLDVGESVQLNAAIQSPTGSTVDLALFTLSWSSSDGGNVGVEPNGVITGVRAGTAVVTARAERVADAMVLTASVDVAVSDPVAPSCGDGSCDGGETNASCPADCQAPGPVCGDGSCDGGETCSSCGSDCGACPPAPAPCAIPPAGGPAHAYFDALVRRAEHQCNWSLRDQGQLDSLVADPTSTFFTYDPAHDKYSRPQDAAKLVVGNKPNGASLPTKQQLRMALPQITSGTLLFTWDWYWGPEFLANRGNMNHYKVFKFHVGNHAWWTLMHSPSWAGVSPTGADDVAKAWDSGPQHDTPEGLVRREPWTPAGLGAPDQRSKSGEQTRIIGGRWFRYWVEVKLFQPPSAFTEWNSVTGQTLGPHANDPQGRWHMVSQWLADENGDVRRLLYRVPFSWSASWNPALSRFDFEMNTSQSTDGYTFVGPLIGYGRNVVMLHNYRLPSVPETDSFLFQRPIR